jgi:quercetin dioxygenase-like cupin family protein
MPFNDQDAIPARMFHGKVRRVTTGENLQFFFETLEVGQAGEPHSHENEQLTIMLRGAVDMRLGDEKLRVSAGDVIFIPAWEEHQLLDTIEESYAVDIFSPPKPDQE